MKKQLLIFTLICILFSSKAQDQLYKKDNTKLLVKVTEVSPEEIKYKLFSNLNGPTYVVSKSDISVLIYENGQYEVINTTTPSNPGTPPTTSPYQSVPPTPYARAGYGMSRPDSLKYYKYSESIAMNFLNFLNMEVGLIYQKDFFKSNFNITIPLAIGIQSPAVTQSIYFNNNSSGLVLDRKLFEVGLGFNYYPSLKFPVNYYVGPTIRFMQYDCQQNYYYRGPSTPGNPYGYNTLLASKGTLSRYCVSITNGFIFRTKSRLMINMFASLGFKNDVTTTKIVDPNTNIEIKPISEPIGLYFWSGLALGFGF